jgi:ribosomal protein L11 methyltransferase
MLWLEISVETDGEAAEAVAEVLRPFAYQNSVALEQRGDESSLDPHALEPTVTVKIYLPEAEDTPALRQRIEEILYHLNRLYPIAAPRFRHLAEEDWANAWKAHYHPFRVGRHLLVRPSWWEEESRGAEEPGSRGEIVERPGDIVMTLDPGMAFGTGLHPTTQSCLLALEQVIRPGMTVLDVGTGSGILAIAAAKLGASSIVAVDTDAIAVSTAGANAAENGVADQIRIWQGSLDAVPLQPWDVVVVNILATVILELLAEGGLMGYVASGGALLLSGIIDQQAAAMEQAIAESGGEIIQMFTIRDWVTYLVRRVTTT